MNKSKLITCNGSEWSPDKAFEKLQEIFINTLDESLPILGSAKTGVQKTRIDNQVKNAAAKNSEENSVYKTQKIMFFKMIPRLHANL